MSNICISTPNKFDSSTLIMDVTQKYFGVVSLIIQKAGMLDQI